MTRGTARASSAYSFETGADRILNTTTGTAPTSVGFQPCFAGVGTGGGQGSCPANGALANEGRDEALEFAAGNFGLVESAYAYGKDVTPPATTLDSRRRHAVQGPDQLPVHHGQRAVGHPLHDGRLHADAGVARPTRPSVRAASARS